jgi:hypothetical protein
MFHPVYIGGNMNIGKKLAKRLALGTMLLSAFTFAGVSNAQAATNGSHATNFSISVGGTSFFGTVYYHNSGIGTSDPNHMFIDALYWETNPSAYLDRITIYGDTSGNNTYPTMQAEIDGGYTGVVQNDVSSGPITMDQNTSYYDAGGVGLEYMDGPSYVNFANGTNLWFEVCVTGGVGNSGDHQCVKHPSN